MSCCRCRRGLVELTLSETRRAKLRLSEATPRSGETQMNFLQMFWYRQAVRTLYRLHEIETEERGGAAPFF